MFSVSCLFWLFFLQFEKPCTNNFLRMVCCGAQPSFLKAIRYSKSVVRCYINLLPFLILVWQYFSDCSGECHRVAVMQHDDLRAAHTDSTTAWGNIFNIKWSNYILSFCFLFVLASLLFWQTLKVDFVTVEKRKWARMSVHSGDESELQRV